MIDQIIGGILAGLIAVALYVFFMRIEEDKAPLFYKRRLPKSVSSWPVFGQLHEPDPGAAEREEDRAFAVDAGIFYRRPASIHSIARAR